MELYLLERSSCDVGWDEYESMLVRAMNGNHARFIANERCADEGAIWTDTRLVRCTAITSEGDSGVVVAAFNAG